MFERFTEGARQVVVLAQKEARLLNHNHIGTEHLLLGMLREEGEGLSARALASLELTVERVRDQVVRIVGSGEGATPAYIPFTPSAKKALELSLREALMRGHNYIGTEHLLLGLASENEGIAARILLDFDADSEKVRNEVSRVMAGRRPEQPRRLDSAEALPMRQAMDVSYPAQRRGGPEGRAVAPAATPASFAQVLARALEQAATEAGDRTLDAGDLMIALLEQPDGLISSALAEAGVEVGALRAAVEAARLRGK